MKVRFFTTKTLFYLLSFFAFFPFLAISNNALANQFFSDEFTDINGVFLSNHNALWEGYSELDNAIISNNQVKSNGSNSSYVIPSLINLTDYCVQADFPQPLPQTPPPDFFLISTRRLDSDRISHHYDAGLNASGNLFMVRDYSVGLYSSTPNLPDGIHTIKLCSVGANQSLYLDSNLITTVIDNTYSSGAPGFDLGNNTPLDNFLVTSAAQPTPTPLLVPELKQTNPNWKSQVYDSANKWSPQAKTIESWGCALTSAAMVLNYYNIVKLPDTSFITPGTLNKWLKSQKDGYVGNGLVNWLAISRLSKIAKASGFNPNFTHDALEFDRQGANTLNQLTSDIQANHPDILQENGHFVVAKGIQNDTFLINDPYYNYTTLADGYNNSFIALDRFLPSNTDLSYFLITGNKDLQFDLKDNTNTSIGDVFDQDQLLNENNSSQKSGDTFTELLAKEPESGNYTLKLTSSNPMKYSLNFYLYDSNGDPFLQTLSGFVSNGKSDQISFTYNHNNHIQTAVKKLVTFDSLIDDINEAVTLKKLDKTVGNILIGLVKAAKANSPQNNKLAIQTLNAGQTVLNTTKNTLIQKDAFTILNDDFSILIASLH